MADCSDSESGDICSVSCSCEVAESVLETRWIPVEIPCGTVLDACLTRSEFSESVATLCEGYFLAAAINDLDRQLAALLSTIFLAVFCNCSAEFAGLATLFPATFVCDCESVSKRIRSKMGEVPLTLTFATDSSGEYFFFD